MISTSSACAATVSTPPTGRQPLDVRTETIEVAGADPVTITVRVSPHGPLISDPEPDFLADATASPDLADPPIPAEYAVALRWTALDPGTTADAVFALNTATNWTEFRDAASRFEVPAQNMVYADVEGNIGYQAPGRIPVRASGDGGRAGAGLDRESSTGRATCRSRRCRTS